jgi:hypothetical protein
VLRLLRQSTDPAQPGAPAGHARCTAAVGVGERVGGCRVLFLLFFLSGAAALVYEVAWTRSLGLVFGASHLAVTTVLAVYMGGQALGSALLGERSDRTDRPLRLYGLLEIGVDNGRKQIYGQRYLSGKYEQLEAEARRYVDDTLRQLRAAAKTASRASGGGADEAVVEAALRGAADRVVGHLSR